MAYSTKQIAYTLKAAREARGLSQREVSKLVGVPQSHISRIESGAVDLRVSSLVELARVLGLELAFVPGGSLAAVNSIVRSMEKESRPPDPVVARLWRKVAAKIDALSQTDPTNVQLAQLQRLARDLDHISLRIIDRPAVQTLNRKIAAALKKRKSGDLNRVLIEMIALRNAAAHRATHDVPDTAGPAYSLEDDSDAE